jgi:AraC-like DNA-binding protein
LLAILLFAKKDNHTANIVLATGMLALSIDIFHSAYIAFNYYESFPHFIGITFAFPFLYGPIFYLYAKLVSSVDNSFKSKYCLHFIPFLLVVIYGMIFVYFKSGDFKIALAKGKLATPIPFLKFIGYLKPVHGIIYVLLTISVVRDFNSKIKNSFSSIEQINLKWLMHLTIGLSFVWGVVVLSFVVNFMSTKEIHMDYFIYLTASILIYSIGYFALRQPHIFSPRIQKSDSIKIMSSAEQAEKTAGYQKSGLSEEEAIGYQKKLIELMEKDKPYLNNELTLRDLADKLSMSTHNLSEILNTRINQSFYDFINNYRVEEVKKRLAQGESEKYNLMAIAFDSGFNSKTAFNTIFKKITGLTPSQYRKQTD